VNVFALAQTYRSIGRLREIALILSRHGFNQILEAVGLGRLLPLSRRFHGRSGLVGDIPVPVQVRMALEDLGPTFVKLGQMLATRPDLVPPDFVEEFRKLQDRVPPFSFDQARAIVEEEVGAPVAEVFAEVDSEPLAAGSIAQAHRARLPDGTRLVLKVQRPGIERTVSHDLSALYLLVGLIERYIPESRSLNLRGIVDEFSRVIRREMDFFLEAANTERFRQNFEGFEGIVVPGVVWELTTKRLLALESIDGTPVDDVDALRARGVDPTALSRVAARAFLKQVFDDGLFHGDLHSGNLLVTPKGDLAFLDFGAVGYLSEDVQE
jgi:ubiquinone biosynthesis protein